MYGEKSAGQQYDARNEAYDMRLGASTHLTNECGPSVNQGAMTGGLRRSNVRQRIERTLMEAQNTYQRAAAAQRAKDIIDAHPEFAELLDALDQF